MHRAPCTGVPIVAFLSGRVEATAYAVTGAGECRASSYSGVLGSRGNEVVVFVVPEEDACSLYFLSGSKIKDRFPSVSLK